MTLLHYFNPGHENAVLNRLPSYTAPASMTTIMKDLAFLPAWYADSNDLVFVESLFSLDFLENYKKLGFQLPDAVIGKRLFKYDNLKVNMWGISPQAIRIFENLNKAYSVNIEIPGWNEKYIYFTSREYAKDVLEKLMSTDIKPGGLSLPLFLSDLQSIENIIQDRQTKLVAKSPYSSSGRGLLWIPQTGIARAERQLLQGMLKRQGMVSIEPFYNKAVDFAMEFIANGCGCVTFSGYSLFSTSEKGVYTGNILQSQNDILNYLLKYIDKDLLIKAEEYLKSILSEVSSVGYRGCIGVDMMIYEYSNSFHLHPCVEINLRYNMGYLSVKLFEKHVSKSSKAFFNVEFNTPDEINKSHIDMSDKYPVEMQDDKIVSGYLSLCPINSNTQYRAYILVEAEY